MAYWYLRDMWSVCSTSHWQEILKYLKIKRTVPFLIAFLFFLSIIVCRALQPLKFLFTFPKSLFSLSLLSSIDLWISKKQCPSSFPLSVKDASRSAPNLFIASYWLLIFPFITNSLLFKSILRNGTTLKIHNSERLRALYVTRITNSLCLFCIISNSLP